MNGFSAGAINERKGREVTNNKNSGNHSWHAQALVYTLLSLMPSAYQRDSLQAMLGLFLEAQGQPSPQHSLIKSGSALSRFLNEYAWPTRQVVRVVRRQIVQQLLQSAPKVAVPGCRWWWI
ncbi:hypothetical protein O77CONTIG1_04368 [Leptolyngbya sp. O-77]|nr:hypothetical protein O77CONTIG1_04368 [Leptolyngbya sp. O-77]